MNDRQEGILFTIDCLNSHKYNFDYNLEELVKEAKKLQSNWNSLREYVKEMKLNKRFDNDVERFTAYDDVLDKMNELEGGDSN
jgi:predicted nuclease with TOPRIM domain